MNFYPLFFSPIIKTLIWGREEWLISSVKGNESIVQNGEYSGKKLNQLVAEYGSELLGAKFYKESKTNVSFPLLVKFIASEKDLSIQVHPQDDIAFKRHGCLGKNEMWLMLGANNGAKVLSGFNQKISKKELLKSVEDGTITNFLNTCFVKKGDVYYLPAGRVHSIGGGCDILEIQQSSDITYRLYDYKRLGIDGKPRQLHIDMALDAIDCNTVNSPNELVGAVDKDDLIKCKYFYVRKHVINSSAGDYVFDLRNRSCFTILVNINDIKDSSHNGMIFYRSNGDEDFKQEVFNNRCAVLLPAGLKSVFLRGNFQCVECCV